MSRMLCVAVALLVVLVTVAGAGQGAGQGAVGAASARGTVASAPVAVSSPRPAFVPVAFRSHFHSGGFGLFHRRSRFGSRSRHPLLRHIVHTAIGLYLLHLFFSHGGLSILLWIVIIAVVVSLLRRRRRRYAY